MWTNERETEVSVPPQPLPYNTATTVILLLAWMNSEHPRQEVQGDSMVSPRAGSIYS
jgi:hypothetical protein